MYLARKNLNVGGRMVQGGQPMPDEGVTRTLIELDWIYLATGEEEAAAIAKHGRPPEKLSVGWEYETTAPKAPAKKPAAKKKTAASVK